MGRMLDIKILREEPEKVKAGIEKKGADPGLVDQFLKVDSAWREVTQTVEGLRGEQKKASEARDAERGRKLKAEVQDKEIELRKLEEQREELLGHLPNVPFEDVPVGKDDRENKVLREAGELPSFDFPAKDYLALAGDSLIDVERAGKVSGSRFGYIKNDAALLEFALVDFAMKTLAKEGFTPIVPPVMVRPEVMKGMGKIKFLEDKDAFYLPEDNLYLVGSSEHSIGPMYMDEVFKKESDLPLRYVGFSTCFRREAGSYGKDTKGILRVHQFDKVEMFAFTRPEDSRKEHEYFLSLQEKLMRELGLPYRVVAICTGDMGWGDARQYDIETWIPSEKRYRETQSCSNTTDFQARGLNIKYKNADGKSEFVHTLNGTAFAIGRMLIAIFENYQTKDGTIKIPEALQGYVGKTIIG